MRAAVTGGAGFLGSVLVDQLLEQGWSVSALVRDPSRMKPRSGLTIVAGDLANAAALGATADKADVFFHLAGVTLARDAQAFAATNVDGAVRAAHIAAAAGAKFIHISSLSARQPETSPYAASKAESERKIARIPADKGWVALRLPAIYGPGDRATLPYFKLVKAGLALEPATRTPARATLLYVADAAECIIAAAEAPPGVVYEVGDDMPGGREWREIGETLGAVMGKSVRRICAPRWAVAGFHGATRLAERLKPGPPSIRPGQINEFFHPDWVARETLLEDAVSWRARTTLKEGFAKTVRWYQEHGLIK